MQQIERSVLLVVHTEVSVRYLARYAHELEGVPSVRFCAAVWPDLFGSGVEKAIEKLPAELLPFDAAVGFPWDMVWFAAHGGADVFGDGVIKLHIQHGLGAGKAIWGDDYTYGPSWTTRHGRPIYDCMFEASDFSADRARRFNPMLRDRILVVGDLLCDDLLEAQRSRDELRTRLNLCPSDVVVLACSTWGPGSLFERYPDVVDSLKSLGAGFAPRMRLHPHYWHGDAEAHETFVGGAGSRDWIREAERRAGDQVEIVPEKEDFITSLTTADVALIDHGSLSLFWALLGKPALAVPWPSEFGNVGSARELLQLLYPEMTPGVPIGVQLERAMTRFDSGALASFAPVINSFPGAASRRVRSYFDDVLGLGGGEEPASVQHRESQGPAW